MNKLLSGLQTLPWLDWLALACFVAAWAGYVVYAKRHSTTRPSVLALTNRERQRWMLQSTWRDNRVLDGIVVQSLSSSPSFFASTTILVIGALLAVLGANDRASELLTELPFATRTSVLVFDLKVVMLTAIFAYAFFRFTWAVRQYSFGALLIGSCPPCERITDDGEREAFAQRAGRVMGLAAESFNDGLRAVYFAFAAVAWFFSAWAFVAATLGVVIVLYRREFMSQLVDALS